MKKKSLVVMLFVVLTFIFCVPAVATQTDIDFDKIAKEAQKYLDKTDTTGQSPERVELIPIDKSKGDATAYAIGPLGYGDSYVDQSPFSWGFVLGKSTTTAFNQQPYVYVESWMYKRGTLVSHGSNSTYWGTYVSYFHPEMLKGGVGTVWQTNLEQVRGPM
ncbi:MAG: hypothetical protein ACYC21_02960 [Eubacteriales bacterium]